MDEPASDDAPPVDDRCAGPENLGPKLGLVLLILGLLWGSARWLERIPERPASPAGRAAGVLEALTIVAASGTIGWAATVGWRLALVAAGRRRRAEDARLALQARAVSALERLAEGVATRPAAVSGPVPPDLERGRMLAELDRVLRSGPAEEAGSLLEGFVAAYPDDPAVAERWDRLEAARRAEVETSLEGIRAARQVNDANRVMELFRGLGPAFDAGRRGELERELSRWLLELIHRRLRGGRIQVDLVELATAVAETFPATVEGASLRASLPTLRRSVGLCPRCAQPYVGTAAACPRCVAGAAVTIATGEDLPDDEPDEASPPPRDGSSEEPDDGWLLYNEDDRDDPVAPA